ncbi:hypothetical protein ASPCAL12151 [Aspergillus calidoustus]|uniref:Uncharacterized protein n=1 Tax=Aspergillus calidoustus TaxID=454130 RepID=A0A0U5GGH9_ASPCI|nr:hypothetical protein ASPCAL12151 [Aspergillus calidoustus]
MKLPSVLSTTAAALLLGNASAFSGQMAAGEYTLSAQLGYGQSITLTDYYTGSQYYAWLYGGFNACVNNKCTVHMRETTAPATYKFDALMWRTNDGCHNIDFQGALDAGHGYCCGSLPCDFTA